MIIWLGIVSYLLNTQSSVEVTSVSSSSFRSIGDWLVPAQKSGNKSGQKSGPAIMRTRFNSSLRKSKQSFSVLHDFLNQCNVFFNIINRTVLQFMFTQGKFCITFLLKLLWTPVSRNAVIRFAWRLRGCNFCNRSLTRWLTCAAFISPMLVFMSVVCKVKVTWRLQRGNGKKKIMNILHS